MQREELIAVMVKLLQGAIDEHATAGDAVRATAESSLVGADAVVTSMGLVALITDIEVTLAANHGLELTLVSEKALSRKNSPFRTVETLADYVLELTGAPAPSETLA